MTTISNPNWEIPSFNMTEFFPKKTKYAVVIPVINEGERIKNQLIRMQPYSALADILLVDGGSTDGSIDLPFLKSVGIRGVMIKTGSGKQSAQLRMGLAYGIEQGYQGFVLVDGNNKDNPDAIARFIAELDKGGDHIQGSRFVPGGKHENTPFLREWGIRLVHARIISMAGGFKYTDTTNGFKAYSTKFLLDPRVQPFRNVFQSYELHSYLAIRAAQLKLNVWEIPVERVYPSEGPSPTKIKGIRGPLMMLWILFSAFFHKFDPKLDAEQLTHLPKEVEWV